MFFVGYTHHHLSHDFTSSSSSVGLVFDYWKLHGARRTFENCGLNSNACVAAALTSPQYRSRMLSIVCLFTILCLLVNVSARVTIVWARGFDY